MPSSVRRKNLIRVALARMSDLEGIVKIDRLAIGDETRRNFIRDSIRKGECYRASINDELAGFAIFNTGAFFDQGFIWLLITRPEHRRKGVATSLINHIESNCDGPKLFTSTNESNKEMQNLLAKLGFTKTGYLENLDEGDPEIFYFKRIERNIRSSKEKNYSDEEIAKDPPSDSNR
jgi:ribosomal protein S18 acetylase RimI-like enzyme